MNGERSETGSGPTAEQEGTTLDDLGGSDCPHCESRFYRNVTVGGRGAGDKAKGGLDSPLSKR